MTTYCVSGYGYGSTNGQKPKGRILVLNATDKAHAEKIGLRVLRTYKVISQRLAKTVDLEEFKTQRESWGCGMTHQDIDASKCGGL